MSAIFNVILKWSKTPEVVEARFYDEVFFVLCDLWGILKFKGPIFILGYPPSPGFSLCCWTFL